MMNAPTKAITSTRAISIRPQRIDLRFSRTLCRPCSFIYDSDLSRSTLFLPRIASTCIARPRSNKCRIVPS